MVITGASPVQVLDVTGPLEVFSSVPGYQLELGIRREIRCSERIADWGGPIDTLVIAGGPGSAGGVYDRRFPRVDTGSGGTRSRMRVGARRRMLCGARSCEWLQCREHACHPV